MSDKAISYVRTYWLIIVGHITTFVVAWILERFGIKIDSLLVFEAVNAVLMGLIYAAGKWLENLKGSGWFSVLGRTLGHWLMSAGKNLGQPSYNPPQPLPSNRGPALRRDW